MLALNWRKMEGGNGRELEILSKIASVSSTFLLILAHNIGFGAVKSMFYTTKPILYNLHYYYFHVILTYFLMTRFVSSLFCFIFKSKRASTSKLNQFLYVVFHILALSMLISVIFASLYKGYSIKVFGLFTIQAFEVNEAMVGILLKIHDIFVILFGLFTQTCITFYVFKLLKLEKLPLEKLMIDFFGK
jgi:hypothetical protein